MSRWSAWRVPLRVARRDALRSRGRSALIVAMIGVPVLGLGAVDVLYRTVTIDTHERVNLEMGTKADAWVRLASPDGATSTPITQPVDATGYTSPPDAKAQPAPALDGLLPTGSHVAVVDQSSASVAPGDDLADGGVEVVLADVRDSLVAGVYRFAGEAPTTTRQILASPSFLAWRGLHVGSDVALYSGSGTSIRQTYRIVGVLHDRNTAPIVREVLALPGAVVADTTSQGPTVVGKVVYGGNATFLVKVPGGVPWADVLKLNTKGYLVFSRQVVAHPPARSAVPYETQQGGSGPLSVQTLFGILIAVLVVGLALLEVCLLAGAAFAVGVRRQTRTLGLLSASGADAKGIRRTVLAQGVVLGLAAAVIGVPVAILLARLGLPVIRTRDKYTVYGPFDIRPMELLGIGCVAVVSGLAAAAIPARTASRLDPVRALAGRRGQPRSPKRWPLIGVALASLGTLLSITGAARVLSLYRSATGQGSSVYAAATLLVVGAALVQIGLIIATPAIIGAAGRLGAYLPLAPRLALRDSARNRGRAAPAVGAVLAAVAASSALTLYVASQDDHDRRHYAASLLSGQGQVSLRGFDDSKPSLDAATVATALRQTLPVGTSMLVRTTTCADQSACTYASFEVPKANECPDTGPFADPQAEVAATRRLAKDWRCHNDDSGLVSRFRGDPVGDAAFLSDVMGVRLAAADAVLARGGVVVFQRAFALNGTARVDVADQDGTKRKTVTLPAIYVHSNGPGVTALWSPAAAKLVGYAARDDSLVLTFTNRPSKAQLKAASAKSHDLGVPFPVYVETGYHSNYNGGLLALVGGAALVTLLATGVATGLSQADARPDHATLSAVGASPGVRRTLAGAQSWSLALLGTMLGVVAGFVPAVALMWARPDFNVIVPWRPLALTLVAVPVLAGLGALLLTRSRLPLDRRLT